MVIPAWNEEEALPGVLRELAELTPDVDVLVVNDGSSDGTSLVAHSSRAQVLDLPLNLGVGGAMRAGYKFALRNNYDVAIQLDADGQHDPASIGSLLARMSETSSDVVIGARFAGVGDYVARGPRMWSMRLLSFVLSRVTGTRLTDTTSGFKASNRRAIRLFATNYPAEYLGDTVEALVIASRAGLKVAQEAVAMRPRSGGAPSHGPLKSGIFLLRAVFALLVALTRPTEPLEPEVRP